MDLYYAHPNMAEAVKLCSGTARTKLEGQLQAIKGVAPDSRRSSPGQAGVTGNSDADRAPRSGSPHHTADVGRAIGAPGFSGYGAGGEPPPSHRRDGSRRANASGVRLGPARHVQGRSGAPRLERVIEARNYRARQ